MKQTLKVIDAEPQRLLEVHGIGQVRLGRITAAWQEQKAIAEIMVFLQGLQITPALAVKIYTAYADTDDDPMRIVRRTPYPALPGRARSRLPQRRQDRPRRRASPNTATHDSRPPCYTNSTKLDETATATFRCAC